MDTLEYIFNSPAIQPDIQEKKLTFCKECGTLHDLEGNEVEYEENCHVKDIEKCIYCFNEFHADMIAYWLQSQNNIAFTYRNGTDHMDDYKFFECGIISNHPKHFIDAEICDCDFKNKTVTYMIENAKLKTFIDKQI